MASGRAPEQRRTGGHHDGAKTQQARFVDRLLRREAPGALAVEREIDHHDGVFLDQPDKQDDADQPHDAELGIADHQRQTSLSNLCGSSHSTTFDL